MLQPHVYAGDIFISLRHLFWTDGSALGALGGRGVDTGEGVSKKGVGMNKNKVPPLAPII